MRIRHTKYILSVLTFPLYVYIIAFTISIIICVLLRIKRKLKLHESILYALLAGYLSIVLFRTLLLREVNGVTRAQFIPFWSYFELAKGDRETQYLGKEILLNVMMLLPLGLVLACLGHRFWKTIMIGAWISLAIEVIQFVSHRGLFEFDDIFHNVLGVIIGNLAYFAASSLIRKFKKTRMSQLDARRKRYMKGERSEYDRGGDR